MSFELASCLVTLFLLAGIGTPIGYSIMLASVVYLGFSGLDVALAGEKILQGFYLSTILIAGAIIYCCSKYYECWNYN
jgi:hypothetical protein